MMAERLGSFGPREFLKNTINIDKFTGFFDKFLTIYFFRKRRRRIAAQGNSAMVRDTRDDG